MTRRPSATGSPKPANQRAVGPAFHIISPTRAYELPCRPSSNASDPDRGPSPMRPMNARKAAPPRAIIPCSGQTAAPAYRAPSSPPTSVRGRGRIRRRISGPLANPTLEECQNRRRRFLPLRPWDGGHPQNAGSRRHPPRRSGDRERPGLAHPRRGRWTQAALNGTSALVVRARDNVTTTQPQSPETGKFCADLSGSPSGPRRRRPFLRSLCRFCSEGRLRCLAEAYQCTSRSPFSVSAR